MPYKSCYSITLEFNTTLPQDNENLKEELKKEIYKRKKLKERFLELQDLVNDESVVLVKEVEKRDEEIQTLKDEIDDLKDQVHTSYISFHHVFSCY